MTKHLHNEIERLKKKILAISATVEENVQKAVKSSIKRDDKLAQEVIESDYDIDVAEVELEEDCLKILALHQPVAIDLRFIIAVLKINNDLERIGDEAVNIAERSVFLSSRATMTFPFDINKMSEKVENMLKRSLDSLVLMDSGMARQVCAMDDEVDALYQEVHEITKNKLGVNPEMSENFIHYLGIARHLERIADHATNISEDVIYMIEGIITRHKGKGFS
jgi:phosphate transport system protein